MAILQAYFDESGKLPDHYRHIVFGGIVGRMDELSVFDRKWRGILGSDVDHIHMRHAMTFTGAFKGWEDREDRRDEILIECAKVAQQNSGMLLVSELGKADFESLSTKMKKRIGNPFYGGFEACVKVLLKEFRNDQLSIWCDESQEYAEACLKVYQRMKSLSTVAASRLPSITFANDERFPGLQAADMVAYCALALKRQGAGAHKVVKNIHAILHSGQQGQAHVLYADKDILGTAIVEV